MLIFLVVWSAVTTAGTPPARACSCAITDAVDGLREADAAFVGTLVATGESSTVPTGPMTEFIVAHRFEVERPLKGLLGPTVTVYAPSQGPACGFDVSTDEGRTGLLLDADRGRWVSSSCATVDADQLVAAATGSGMRRDPATRADVHPGSVALVAALLGSLALVARRSVRRSG